MFPSNGYGQIECGPERHNNWFGFLLYLKTLTFFVRVYMTGSLDSMKTSILTVMAKFPILGFLKPI